jgi:hypothetical protein
VLVLVDVVVDVVLVLLVVDVLVVIVVLVLVDVVVDVVLVLLVVDVLVVVVVVLVLVDVVIDVVLVLLVELLVVDVLVVVVVVTVSQRSQVALQSCPAPQPSCCPGGSHTSVPHTCPSSQTTGAWPSAGQVAVVPVQRSSRSQLSTAGRQTVPAPTNRQSPVQQSLATSGPGSQSSPGPTMPSLHGTTITSPLSPASRISVFPSVVPEGSRTSIRYR